jgi:uncharacterized membrane protein
LKAKFADYLKRETAAEYIVMGASMAGLLTLGCLERFHVNWVPKILIDNDVVTKAKFATWGIVFFLILFLGTSARRLSRLLVRGRTEPFHVLHFIEQHAVILLLIFGLLLLSWSCAYVLKFPFSWRYQLGDAGYNIQALHNLTYVGPEQTTHHRANDYLKDNPFFFASIFSVGQNWLPFLLITPIYAIYPHSPVHVIAIIILVISLGASGTFMAIRALGGSKVLSLFGAIGYCMLPQVEQNIFFKGHFDNIGLAILPFFFAALFSKRWGALYVCALLVALINFPYAYTVILLGVMVIFFFKYRKAGLIIAAIGLAIALFDASLFFKSLCGIYPQGKGPPGMIQQFLLSRPLSSYRGAFFFFLHYIISLLLTVSLIPLLALRKQRRWNLQILGMLFLMLAGAAMGSLRTFSWTYHRNANLIVPVYLAAFMGYILLRVKSEKSELRGGMITRSRPRFLTLVVLSGIAAATLSLSRFYPWGGLIYGAPEIVGQMKNAAGNRQSAAFLEIIDKFVPREASLSYNIDPHLEAFLTNRQKAWIIGYQPEGVEYYIIRETDSHGWNIPWREKLAELKTDVRFKLLYDQDGLHIYQNLSPTPIPRLERVLHWDLLKQVVLLKKCEELGGK